MQALLEVNLNPSTLYKGLVGFIYSAVLSALWVASLSWGVALLLSIVALTHGGIYFRQFICPEVEAIRCSQDEWRIKLAGQWYKAWPTGQAVVRGSFMSLPFKMNSAKGRRRFKVVIFPDSAKTSQLHALRLSIMLNGFGKSKKRR